VMPQHDSLCLAFARPRSFRPCNFFSRGTACRRSRMSSRGRAQSTDCRAFHLAPIEFAAPEFFSILCEGANRTFVVGPSRLRAGNMPQ
jgi:hypothetical protein